MNKFILGLVIAGVVGMPFVVSAEEGAMKKFREQDKEKRLAHHEQQKQENKEFRKTLEGLSDEERAKAMSAHMQKQFEENQAFHSKMHEERMSRLKERLGSAEKLSEAQKTDIINFAEEQYQKGVAFHQQNKEEDIKFVEELGKDSSLTKEQKKEAIRTRRQKQKEENKEFRQSLREARKAKRQEIRSAIKPEKEGKTE